MQRSKEQTQDSSFVNPIRSRDAIRLTILSLLFSSSFLPLANSNDVQEGSSRIRFCYDVKSEDHRLNTTIHKHLTALCEFDCAAHCSKDSCCRSANFRKIPPHDGRKNCELLHAVEWEEPENLLENGTYDYIVMIQPKRSFNCSCFSCQNGGTCTETSNKCDCPSGFTGIQCETEIDECGSSPCDKNAEYEEASGDSYTCKCKKGFYGNGTSCEVMVRAWTELRGRRLDSIVYKKERNQSVTGCKNLCFQDDCCRSVNYNKSSSDDNKENCELLNVVEGEQHGHLKYDPHYDHYDLLGPPKTPLKSYSISCSWSRDIGKCGAKSRNFPSGNPKCNRGSLNSSLLLEGNCTLLNELYKWLGSRTQWCLCYGAFQRDWDVTKFHAKCDNKSHTVTIVRSTNGDIVGGYSDIPWSAKDDGPDPKTSHSAFLFSLKNQNSSKPFKLPLKTSPSQDAIYSCSNCGPVFGGGHDLYIASEAGSLKNESLNSYINLNVTYQLPSDVDNQDSFAEKKHFCLSLIEIFHEC